MKKEIKIVDKENKVYRITTLNERWYAKPIENKETGLPGYEYFPSSTWVCSYYYTSPYLIRYIADKGLTESDRLKEEAGVKGSKVHYACSDIDEGKEIDILNDKYINSLTDSDEELKPDEIEAIQSYIQFLEDENPEVLANEISAFGIDDSRGEKISWAGTIDKIMRIGKQIWIVDLKTSKSIWKEHELQISSYNKMDIDYKKLGITDEEWITRKMGILQIGYILNKKRYKFTEIGDKFNLFLNAWETWKEENPNSTPKERDFPLILKKKVAEPAEPVNKIKTKK